MRAGQKPARSASKRTGCGLRLTCAYTCLGLFGSPVKAARSSRVAFVSGWSARSTRSQSARVRLYSGIALAGHPARDAVPWVRSSYCAKAVETPEQEALVAALVNF